MPDANVEVTATFADDPIGPDGPDPVGPSDTGNIQGAISAVVVGAAAGAIIYEAGTGIYRVINMPGIPMPSNRIELAELLWEHAGKPEPVSTALYSDIDEGDTDAQKAARWAVEQDLMKDDADNNKFNPYFPVSKLRTCLTWNAAKKKACLTRPKNKNQNPKRAAAPNVVRQPLFSFSGVGIAPAPWYTDNSMFSAFGRTSFPHRGGAAVETSESFWPVVGLRAAVPASGRLQHAR